MQWCPVGSRRIPALRYAPVPVRARLQRGPRSLQLVRGPSCGDRLPPPAHRFALTVSTEGTPDVKIPPPLLKGRYSSPRLVDRLAGRPGSPRSARLLLFRPSSTTGRRRPRRSGWGERYRDRRASRTPPPDPGGLFGPASHHSQRGYWPDGRPAGVRGLTGTRGLTGATDTRPSGLVGPTGTQGSKTGPQGLQGPAGPRTCRDHQWISGGAHRRKHYFLDL